MDINKNMRIILLYGQLLDLGLERKKKKKKKKGIDVGLGIGPVDVCQATIQCGACF